MENEITGFHAAQRFIEPQNHQRFVSTPNEMAKVSEIVKKIKKQTNCYLFREGRNHEIWLNPDTGKEFQIPRHYSKELPIGTANNILKAAGLLGR